MFGEAPQERKIIAHGASRGRRIAHQSSISIRYPDDLPEDVRPEEAVQAMTAASHLREFVLAAREQKGNHHGFTRIRKEMSWLEEAERDLGAAAAASTGNPASLSAKTLPTEVTNRAMFAGGCLE
jgi:hypothetical protein